MQLTGRTAAGKTAAGKTAIGKITPSEHSRKKCVQQQTGESSRKCMKEEGNEDECSDRG